MPVLNEPEDRDDPIESDPTEAARRRRANCSWAEAGVYRPRGGAGPNRVHVDEPTFPFPDWPIQPWR
jgi:hypothetical protein